VRVLFDRAGVIRLRERPLPSRISEARRWSATIDIFEQAFEAGEEDSSVAHHAPLCTGVIVLPCARDTPGYTVEDVRVPDLPAEMLRPDRRCLGDEVQSDSKPSH
jgi:hypothetical protein